MTIKRTILKNVFLATSVAVFSFIDMLIALPSLINQYANNMSGLLMLAYKTGTIGYVGYGKLIKSYHQMKINLKSVPFIKKEVSFNAH